MESIISNQAHLLYLIISIEYDMRGINKSQNAFGSRAQPIPPCSHFHIKPSINIDLISLSLPLALYSIVPRSHGPVRTSYHLKAYIGSDLLQSRLKTAFARS